MIKGQPQAWPARLAPLKSPQASSESATPVRVSAGTPAQPVASVAVLPVWPPPASAAVKDEERLSLAELARAQGEQLLQSVMLLAATLSPQTQPHDRGLYNLRKAVLRLRQHLDVFAHCFAVEKKRLIAMRELCDQGYEVLGGLKDLFHEASGNKSYDMGEVEACLDKAMAWRERMTSAKNAQALAELLLSADEPQKLDNSLQSRFFWRAADSQPKPKKSGYENLRRLVAGMLTEARELYSDVKKIKHLSGKEADAFHDLRKQIRSALNVVDAFPVILKGAGQAERTVLVEMIDRYGKLGDKLVVLTREGKQSRVTREEIAADWVALKAWQEQVGARHMMRSLAACCRAS